MTFTYAEMVKHLVAMDVPRSKAEAAASKYAEPDAAPAKRKRGVSVERKAFDFAAMKFKLLCKVEGLPQPVQDHEFAKHRGRGFEIDFAWPDPDDPDSGVGIEVQGGIWRKGGGAHQGKGHVRDMEKLNLATVHMRWHIIQVQPKELCTDATIALVRAALTPIHQEAQK